MHSCCVKGAPPCQATFLWGRCLTWQDSWFWRRLPVIIKTRSLLVLCRDSKCLNTSSWAVDFLFGTGVRTRDMTTTKTPCVHNCLTFVGGIRTRHGGILQAQLGGKLRLFLQRWTASALCTDSVHLAARQERSCSVWQIRRGKKYLSTMKTKGLALSKSALCLIQFKSKDNQECLFDNSIYNALFCSPEPPKQRQIGFKQVI